MNRKQITLVALAISAVSSAAFAAAPAYAPRPTTVAPMPSVRPVEAPPVKGFKAEGNVITPKAFSNRVEALKAGTAPQVANENTAAQDVAPKCDDERTMYANVTEGTRSQPEAVHEMVTKGYVQIAANGCKVLVKDYSPKARTVLFNTSACAMTKSANENDPEGVIQGYTACQVAAKKEEGMDTNEAAERPNVIEEAVHCDLFPAVKRAHAALGGKAASL